MIDERARLAAWQIFGEIGLSQHSVDRVAEIIAEKIHEQKAIDDAKAKEAFNKVCGWLYNYPWFNKVADEFIKALEE